MVQLNVDQNQAFSQRYGIKAIPHIQQIETMKDIEMGES